MRRWRWGFPVLFQTSFANLPKRTRDHRRSLGKNAHGWLWSRCVGPVCSKAVRADIDASNRGGRWGHSRTCSPKSRGRRTSSCGSSKPISTLGQPRPASPDFWQPECIESQRSLLVRASRFGILVIPPQPRRMSMQSQAQTMSSTPRRQPWNKGKLIGQKPRLRPKHVWSIRTRPQMDGRTRDLAMFNLAIDSLGGFFLHR